MRTAGARGFTPREREVLHLVVQGLTNGAIAARLGIGERTVETHVSNILKKLGLATRVQLLARAVRQPPATADDPAGRSAAPHRDQ